MAALPEVIAEHLEEIRGLCVKNRVTRLVLVDDSAPRFGGDVPDFVVDFEAEPDPLVRGRRYRDLWEGLLDLLGADLNLVVESTIKDSVMQRAIENAHHDIYATA